VLICAAFLRSPIASLLSGLWLAAYLHVSDTYLIFRLLYKFYNFSVLSDLV
jgi:hypothetical protein